MKHFLSRFDERLQLIIIGSLVGICGGLVSVTLNRCLAMVSSWLYPLRGHWYAFIVPACGAALSCVFLHYVVRDIGAHGVPEVVYSISRCGGLLRLRSSFSRLISCLLTIASGGSAGPEGPVVISGGSLGSNIASFFRLKDRHRIVIVGCGASAAIASIFNAPVAGIAFSLEVILGEWTSINLIPIAISSVVGTEVSRFFQGNQIPFQHSVVSIGPLDTIACLGLSIFTAFASVFLIRFLNYVNDKSKTLIPYVWLRAASGGLFVGFIGLFFPMVLGEGYEVIRTILDQNFSPSIVIVGLAILAKITATSLTIGSGGSGGLFAPCLVIGCFTGLFYSRVISFFFPAIAWSGESIFALFGMSGMISSVLQAPMTGIFLVTEITGNYRVLLSVVLVSMMSAALSRFFEPYSVYHQELINRGDLVRPRTDRRILSDLNVMELLETDCYIVQPEMQLKDLLSIMQHTKRNYFPVEDPKSGNFLGMIHMNDIRAYLLDPHLYESLLLEELMDAEISCITPDDDLAAIFELFDRTQSWSLPVVQNKKFLGLISKSTIFDCYRRELLIQEET